MSRANCGSTPCAVVGRKTLSRSVTKKLVSVSTWFGTCGPKNWNHTGYATTGTNRASAHPRHASAYRQRAATWCLSMIARQTTPTAIITASDASSSSVMKNCAIISTPKSRPARRGVVF